MAEYQLTDTEMVVRTADNAWIPNDPANSDRIEYDKWVTAGGVPDPYIPPDAASPGQPIKQQPTPEVQVMFDHEKRLRSLENRPGPPTAEPLPTLTIEEFMEAMNKDRK